MSIETIETMETSLMFHVRFPQDVVIFHAPLKWDLIYEIEFDSDDANWRDAQRAVCIIAWADSLGMEAPIPKDPYASTSV